MRLFKRAAAFAAAAIVICAGPSLAQDYPTKPVRFIVPFNAGGGTDVTARIIAGEMSKSLGQPVLVENRPGAQGIAGTKAGAEAAPDGYTMVFVLQATLALNPSLYLATNYDPIADFEPVAQITESPYVIAVHPSLGVNNIAELVSLAKESSGKVNYASGAAAAYLSSLLFQRAIGVEMTHIPYSGSGQALTDLLSGRVSLMLSSPVSVLPHIQSGKLKAIGITSAERSPSLPDVPTVAKSGYAGFEVSGWYGVSVPKGTSPEIVAKLNKAIVDALANDEVKKNLEAVGVEAKSSSSKEFAALISAEIERWTTLIKDAGIKAE